nr:hypothetical protein BDOA9_0151990 [Bradyrhizobium sp. DOA9]
MIEALMRVGRRRVDRTIALERCDEDPGAAEIHVDPSGRVHDLATKDVPQPGCRGLRIGAAQMDVIPSDGEWHLMVSNGSFDVAAHVSGPGRWSPPLLPTRVMRGNLSSLAGLR